MRILKHRKAAKKRNRTRHAIKAERLRMRITKGDTVVVMRGDDRGKEGKVLEVFAKTGRVKVDGVNIVKRHRKARGPDDQGGIMEMPAPIHVSNVMLMDPSSGKATRIAMRVDEDGTKERLSIKGGGAIPRTR